MDKSEFNKQQYLTLRKEIEDCKSRMFTLSIMGPAVLPIAQWLSRFYSVDETILVVPLLLIAIALFYSSENHAMMRAGRYIKEYLEPQNALGWEKWLEECLDFDTRKKEKFGAWGFYVIMTLLYAVSVYMAMRFLQGKFVHSQMFDYLEIGIFLLYLIIGGWITYFLFNNHTEGTKIRSTTNPAVKRIS